MFIAELPPPWYRGVVNTEDRDARQTVKWAALFVALERRSFLAERFENTRYPLEVSFFLVSRSFDGLT